MLIYCSIVSIDIVDKIVIQDKVETHQVHYTNRDYNVIVYS